MLLNLREYQRPGEGAPAGRERERLDRALALLARPHVRTAVLAGGDVLVGSADAGVEAVVDLQGLGLDQVIAAGDRLLIGAMVSRSYLIQRLATVAPMGSEMTPPAGLPGVAALLAAAAHHWGGNVQRNRATVGGAVAVAAANDPLAVALLACDAGVVLYSDEGSHEIPLADFFERRMAWLAAPALITDISVPLAARPAGAALAGVGRTPADAPIVLAVAMLTLNEGRCETARLALGGVAEQPIRLVAVEDRLAGRAIEDGLIQTAAAQVPDLVHPVGDYRGSAEYRRVVAGVLSARALREAWAQAR